MKYRLIYLILIICLSGISACIKTEDVSSDFNENVTIRMFETVDSTKRTLILDCNTEKIFICANYQLETSYILANDKITISFTGISEPKICLDSPRPASARLSLDGLENKAYPLEINLGTRKFFGQLNVTSESFQVTLLPQIKFQFINPELKRVPINTIYGTIHYDSSLTNPTVQKFIDSLQFYGATPTLYKPGDYGQFQIESNGQIKQTQDLGYYFTFYYIFNYSNNTEQLKSLVKRFGINYSDSLVITLNTTKGEVFYSWKP